MEIAERSSLSTIEFGNKDSTNVIVFLAGFPDDETSGWGDVLDHLKSSRKFSDFRLLCMCLPDFEDGSVPRRWGWSFDEIVSLFEHTIDQHVSKEIKVTLCIHDWGSIIGLLYENRAPDRIHKIICFDIGIGIMRGKQPIFMVYIIFVFYQWWWALAYIFSQSCSFRCGDCCFKSFGALVPTCCQPTALDVLPRSSDKVNVYLCYPYYHFWRLYFFDYAKLPVPKHPKASILFLYGTNKNAMFHGEAFLRRIDSTPGSKQVAINGSHWMTYGEPAKDVIVEVEEFMAADTSEEDRV